jgi:hypothetical protein
LDESEVEESVMQFQAFVVKVVAMTTVMKPDET